MTTALFRFAPSPTGFLHLGNLRPALFNWLAARRAGGRFVLRFDDTDKARSTRAFADAIEEDLAWIGIRPDVTVRQSDRLALYDAAAQALREKGLLYACYETPDELDRKRKRRLAQGLPPVYGREALRLSEDDRARLAEEGRTPHWRFRLPNFDADPFAPRRTECGWDDLIRGPQSIDLASLSDPVLIREDGSYLYTLPSVVDDGEMGVTHVVRGDDHLTNTAVQIAIFEALGYALPVFGHHNLLTTVDGEGLSKRSGALSLRTLREAGYEPMAVASLAVLTGAAGSIDAVPDLDALAQRLEFSAISASSAKFDPSDLDRLNAELVHGLSATQMDDILARAGVPAASRNAFWQAVRANCARADEAADWWRVVEQGPQEPPVLDDDERAFLAEALAALPPEPWDGETWKDWTGEAKAKTGRKGRALFMPLRRALTGLDHGPELAALLPLIGRAGAERRLRETTGVA